MHDSLYRLGDVSPMRNLLLISSLFLFLNSEAPAQSEGPYRTTKVVGSLAKPAQVKFSDDLLKKISVPPGFRVNVFAKDLDAPRMMVVDNDGGVYVSRPKTGEILLLKDTNQDGTADEQKVFIKGYDKVHGMAIEGPKLYFIALKKVYATDLKQEEGKETNVLTLIEGLPDVGQHENRSMAIGPDNMLYIAVASNCNSCVDPNKMMATMQRAKLDGTELKTFAKGLRDTIGFDWHPETKEFFGMDHGTDWLGDEFPREELNQLTEGKDYGWPFCWNDKKADENFIRNPEGSTKEEFCKKSEPPVLTYAAHAAPIAMKFYNGAMFPGDYKGSAFVAFHGSWNRAKPSGYNVARVVFKNGKPDKFEDFMTGFLTDKGKSQFGRPAGLAVLKDGSLLVSDDSAGVIYRVSYKKPSVTKR
jgi:glucose/arabinose dehydrogenase